MSEIPEATQSQTDSGMSEQEQEPVQAFIQLQMVWPRKRLDDPPIPKLPEGYILRTYRPGDEKRWFEVMALASFPDWDEEELKPWLARILPEGWWLAVHQESGLITASAMAIHSHKDEFPLGGEIGWVCADPAHSGCGLGLVVSAAATRRLIEMGYRSIHLYTDDPRSPALATYFKLGYLPYLFLPDMYERWQTICDRINWPYTPEAWPTPEQWQADGAWEW